VSEKDQVSRPAKFCGGIILGIIYGTLGLILCAAIFTIVVLALGISD
jgi:hypothetical protein